MANFKKIIDLLKKVGGRYIITDGEGEPSCVILSLEDYELFLAKNNGLSLREENQIYKERVKSLTDSEMLDKINGDIALWKESKKDEGLDILADDLIDDLEEKDDKEWEAEEDRYYLEPVD
ncbi:MAG: hypothetical protein PHD51_02940 [Patescibacteria group bacterium]|nr:hypothetical protein [Patescibacteria group bacterium]MDD5490189.1 hypothetical protein [Patescibacteria group bacterium]